MGTYKDPDYKKNWSKTPRAKYTTHRAQAKSRGVEFTLTFEEWCALWEPHWSERGKKPGQYCMTRKNDAGNYSLGNVEVSPVAANLAEQLVSGAHVARKLTADDHRQIKKMSGLFTDSEIAKSFGVSQPYVTSVLNGERGAYMEE
jgi:hypothetical protein